MPLFLSVCILVAPFSLNCRSLPVSGDLREIYKSSTLVLWKGTTPCLLQVPSEDHHYEVSPPNTVKTYQTAAVSNMYSFLYFKFNNNSSNLSTGSSCADKPYIKPKLLMKKNHSKHDRITYTCSALSAVLAIGLVVVVF